jgi:CheY-like chemotaxis protein
METTPKTILYVDDDPDDLALFRMAIEEIGSDYRIIEAINGMQALELVEEMEKSDALPKLIVLDINMPRMDGKQTLVAIQSNPLWASIPVVLFSTSSSHLDKIFSISKKVELITKPFNLETLRAVTCKLLSFIK